MGLFGLLKKKSDDGYQKPTTFAPLNSVEIPKPHVMNVKVAGVTFGDRQNILSAMYKKEKPFDKKLTVEFKGVDFEKELAIEVKVNGFMVGYVPKARLKEFVKHMDYGCKIKEVYTGYIPDDKMYYCSIKVEFAK